MITPKRLVPGTTLTTSYVSLYSVTNGTAVVKSLTVCNTTSTSQTVSVQIRPSGGSDVTDSTILAATTLQPNETKIFGLTDVMPLGYALFAKASNASAVSLTASGMENT